MNYTIRTANLDDLSRIAPLFDAYRQFYEQAPDLTLAHNFLRTQMENGISVVLFAEAENGEVLGFCQLFHQVCSVIAAPIFILNDLFVSPAHRRHAIGKALMNAATETAKQAGKQRIDLSTARNNLRAQALYEQCGYQRDDIYYVYNLSLPR